MEFSGIKVSIDGKTNLILIGVYRPPTKNSIATAQALQALDEVLLSIPNQVAPILIVGDINIDSNSPSSETKQFLYL